MKHSPADPRRAANLRCALALFALALAFFFAVLWRYAGSAP